MTFGKSALGLDDSHIELLLGGFSGIGTDMARRARRFDAAVPLEDIFQASRNAWTACGLQMLLGRAMHLTPAIFAYSMLYPYTDNYLDDPSVERAEKIGFNARFGRRLAGDDVPPANPAEDAIWRLVRTIEEQHSRTAAPQIFSALIGIHRAQEQSIRLLRRGAAAETVDVLGLSFAKGGASVLADGYLAAETLGPDEASFIFNWGVLLQLADDLQDVRSDRSAGILTVFSEQSTRGPLDALTSRAIHFAQRVMVQIAKLPGAAGRPLKELIQRSSTSILVRAAGDAATLYTPGYIAELETRTPFRFSFLRQQDRRFAKSRGLFGQLFEAFLQAGDDEPALPFLPSSLMPQL